MARIIGLFLLWIGAFACVAQKDVLVTASEVPENPNSAFEINVDVDRPDRWYKPGERLTISVTAGRPCYVTIFDVGTSGNVTILLPNRFRTDNRIEAGQRMNFPEARDGFEYTTGGPEGPERLVVVGSERPVNLVAADLATYNSRSPFATVPSANARDLMAEARDVLVTQRGDAGDWASDQVTFHIGNAPAPTGAPPTGTGQTGQTGQQKTRIWLFSAAVADYPGVVNDLTYTTSDALTFASTMQQRFGVPESQVRMALDGAATVGGLQAGLDWLAQNAGANDRAYIFYSGHGSTGPDDNDDEDDDFDEFICAYDGQIRDDDFGQWVKRIKCANVVTFIDTCFAGGAGRGIKSMSAGSRATPPRLSDGFGPIEWRAAVRKQTREPAPDGFTMFAASQPDQPSQESLELRQGVFTHYLRKGLEGHADSNRDGVLTLRELFDYTSAEVSRFTHGSQVPALLPHNADLAIAP